MHSQLLGCDDGGGLALGATVATTGSFLARGYADAGETVIDGFINTLSF